jgi:hypothetical protein
MVIVMRCIEVALPVVLLSTGAPKDEYDFYLLRCHKQETHILTLIDELRAKVTCQPTRRARRPSNAKISRATKAVESLTPCLLANGVVVLQVQRWTWG